MMIQMKGQARGMHHGEPIGYRSRERTVNCRWSADAPRRLRAKRVEECLQCLSSFCDTDLRKLRAALDAAGVPGTFIAQDEWDSLFISAA